VRGVVESVVVEPFSGVPTVECRLTDTTGSINLVFLGRRQVPGVAAGVTLAVEGMVGRHRGAFAIINPEFSVIARGSAGETAS
jgi:hypothetical protein